VTTRNTAIHEAGHALAAYAFGIKVKGVSIRPKATHLGQTFVDASGEEPLLDCATIFACGPMAERMFAGKPQRVNWLDVDDSDVSRALWFIDADHWTNPMAARQLVELRARALLFTRWKVLTALADELNRRNVLLGTQVEQLLSDLGTRRAREKPQRPVDPSTRMAVVNGITVRDKQGRAISLRRWATVLDSVGWDTRRALELVAGKEGKR
jgi:hypothetical protein